jgi:hypothetical protein
VTLPESFDQVDQSFGRAGAFSYHDSPSFSLLATFDFEHFQASDLGRVVAGEGCFATNLQAMSAMSAMSVCSGCFFLT